MHHTFRLQHARVPWPWGVLCHRRLVWHCAATWARYWPPARPHALYTLAAIAAAALAGDCPALGKPAVALLCPERRLGWLLEQAWPDCVQHLVDQVAAIQIEHGSASARLGLRMHSDMQAAGQAAALSCCPEVS